MGLEALSRGAESCLFVEQDRAATDALRSNCEKLGIARPDIRQCSVLALGSTPTPLDIIFMDPPYGSGAGAVALDKLSRLGWTGPASWVSIETGHKEALEVKGFSIVADRVVGKAKLHLLQPE